MRVLVASTTMLTYDSATIADLCLIQAPRIDLATIWIVERL